jgi:hypothetical protein
LDRAVAQFGMAANLRENVQIDIAPGFGLNDGFHFFAV